MDFVDKKTRSRFMSAVKSRGNKSTEILMTKKLRKLGIIGWRRHVHLTGTPDFIWPKKKVALFVDGCFWHGCPRCYHLPKSNIKYWHAKIKVNRRRDRRVNICLRLKGWKIIRIWECRILDKRTSTRLQRALLSKTE